MSQENGAAGVVVRNEKRIDREVVGGAPMAGGLVPRNLDEALELVKLLADSELLPENLRKKPSDVYFIIAKGMELGLKPMQALSELFVVKGRPGCSAALKRALCLNSPVCEYFQLIESSSTKCIYEAKRKGAKDPVRLTKTWEDAVRAKLSTKETYQQHPDAMLRAWCSRALADAEFPDVTQGMRNDDDRELDIGGEVLSVKVNRAPESAGAPSLKVVPEADAPMDEAFEVAAREAQGARLTEDPAETDLRARIEKAQSEKEFKALITEVQLFKGAAGTDLQKLWTRCFNDFKKKGAPAK